MIVLFTMDTTKYISDFNKAKLRVEELVKKYKWIREAYFRLDKREAIFVTRIKAKWLPTYGRYIGEGRYHVQCMYHEVCDIHSLKYKGHFIRDLYYLDMDTNTWEKPTGKLRVRILRALREETYAAEL